MTRVRCLSPRWPNPASAAIVSAIALLMLVGGCGLTGPAHGPSAETASAVIDMGFESYSPMTVTERAGGVVEWLQHVGYHAHRNQ
jgi:predicted small lipoprotein YifL